MSEWNNPTALTISEEGNLRVIEGPPCRELMRTAKDVDLIIEACFSAHINSTLLYACNLPPRFFDLSSGEAGTILQKLRNYRIRLAVVCTPEDVQFNSKFRDMVNEEKRLNHFRLFDSRDAAQEWFG
ncbi:MAG TPA: DUF4180 domain-containing protein [Candidatus Angelobacter sp.]|jgi:hypothetical protein|nr:DUF4180 domain-containing protein [Candidatus Angelobacter sp.]